MPRFYRTPAFLRKIVSPSCNTHLASKISDGKRSVCIVRGKVLIERNQVLTVWKRAKLSLRRTICFTSRLAPPVWPVLYSASRLRSAP